MVYVGWGALWSRPPPIHDEGANLYGTGRHVYLATGRK